MVRPGGRLVYATCSLLAAENEEVVGAFLADHPSMSRVSAREILERRTILIPDGFNDFGDLRLYPHRHRTDGFFAAVLERRVPAAESATG